MPLRSHMVQLLPSGAISHFSANSGMYAPVLRSIPTRYSRAGRLSSMPLRLCSQVKFVSQPRGATATRSRSNLVFDGAGVCAQATATASPRTQTIPHSTSRCTHLGIVPSPATAWAEGRQLNGAPFPASATAEGGQFNGPPSHAHGASLTYSKCVKKPVTIPGNAYSAIYLGFTAASAYSQNSGTSANSLNLWSPISRNRRVLSATSTAVLRASRRSSITGCSYQCPSESLALWTLRATSRARPAWRVGNSPPWIARVRYISRTLGNSVSTSFGLSPMA